MTSDDNELPWLATSGPPSENPPADVVWSCEICGPQPPIVMTGNRWIKRRCACQCASRLAERKTLLGRGDQEPMVQHRDPSSRSWMRLGHLFPSSESPGPFPPDLCWVCEACGPVDPLRLPTGRWIMRSCACQRQARKRQEQEQRRQVWLQEQRRRTFGGWLGEKWVDETIVREMCRKTFESYDILRQPEAYAKAYTFAQRPCGNVLFYGTYGTGKTHLEAAILNDLRERGRRDAHGELQPIAGLFVSAPHFFLVYEETKRAFDQTNHIRLVQQVISTPVLVMDDIDKSRPREDRWETYWLIFDERAKARRPTILSTNAQHDLETYIGEASLSRLSRGLLAIEMNGDDYRREEEVQ